MGKKHRSIKDWHDDEKPREKLLLKGPKALSDSELIGILLGSGTRNKSAVELAREMIDVSGDIYKLSITETQSLLNFEGVGTAKAAIISAAMELAKRVKIKGLDEKEKMTSPQKIAKYFIQELSGLTVEKFYIAMLSTANKVLKMQEVTSGILNASLVHPREVFKPAIIHSAASIILVHNHPSGNLNPSLEDKKITEKLVETGKIVDIKVLDHFIIAGDKYYSFKENGLL